MCSKNSSYVNIQSREEVLSANSVILPFAGSCAAQSSVDFSTFYTATESLWLKHSNCCISLSVETVLCEGILSL